MIPACRRARSRAGARLLRRRRRADRLAHRGEINGFREDALMHALCREGPVLIFAAVWLCGWFALIASEENP
jgi:hypothetical protein